MKDALLFRLSDYQDRREGRREGGWRRSNKQCTIDVTTDYPDLSFLSTIQQEIVLHKL